MDLNWIYKLLFPPELEWPARIVLVRHGQSEQNVAIDLLDDLDLIAKMKYIRDADIALTEYGIWQAEQTGLFLKETEKFDLCFSSPYKRTMQTAEKIISKIGYGLEIFEDDDLREKEFGRLHGFTTEEIREKYPEEFHDRERDGKYYYRLPRGENYLDVKQRLRYFNNKLRRRKYIGKNILVVTHQVPYKMERAIFEHLGEKGVLALEDTLNCGIQEYLVSIEKDSHGRMKLNYFNKIAYDQKPYSS